MLGITIFFSVIVKHKDKDKPSNTSNTSNFANALALGCPVSTVNDYSHCIQSSFRVKIKIARHETRFSFVFVIYSSS